MSYIGVPPQATFSSGLLDRFTSTTGTTVTLTHDIASENDIVVFVNFVKQDSTTYSVGGTGNKTLTLGGTLVSSDIVEVHYLNIVGQTNAPSSGSVGSSQLTADVITGQTALASEPADTDEFLVSDAGTLKRIDYSLIKGGGITEADVWTLTSNLSLSGNTETLISANLSRSDDTGFGLLGTGMSVSSGIWTFPSTGFYLVKAQVQHEQGSDSIYNGVRIYCTTDNNTYSNTSNANTSAKSGYYSNVSTETVIDVTDTSNVKVKFYTIAQGGGTARGNSSYKYTGFIFIKLGDT